MDPDFDRHVIDLDAVPPAVAIKWSNPSVLAEGFLPFPKRLLRVLHLLFAKGLDLASLQFLLAVIEFRRLRQARPPSIEFLAFLAGRTADECKSAVKELTDRGWIEVKEDKGRIQVSTRAFEDLVIALCGEPAEPTAQLDSGLQGRK